MNQALEAINQVQELIYIPGSIQPHGLLCVLSELDFRITQVSLNAIEILGIAPEKLIDRPLEDFIDPDRIAEIRACLDPTSEQTNPLNLSIKLDKGATRFFNGIVHRAISGEIVLELEPIAATAKRDFTQSYRSLKDTLAKIQVTKTLPELCDLIVTEVRQITGFDRVMIYRFNQDGDGTVIAEDKQADLEAFLGLYYPDTDIPQRGKTPLSAQLAAVAARCQLSAQFTHWLTGSQANRYEPLRAAEYVTLPHSIFAEHGCWGFDVHFADPAAAFVGNDYLPSQHAQICALRNPHDLRVSRSVNVYRAIGERSHSKPRLQTPAQSHPDAVCQSFDECDRLFAGA